MDLIGKTIGGYRLTAELGRGGMGAVFKGEGPGGRVVAVKVLAKGTGHVLERFRREGELIARVGAHPHVVAVHAAGEHEGLPFLVMELVDGGSLEERLPFPPLEAARLVEETARAVAHLHSLGIVHRDVKPGNVLLGKDGRARLTDFGLARELDRATRLTAMGQLLGTPFYMAPEQLRGSDPDATPPGPLADVYALGALLFACLVGRPPYQARTLAELAGLLVTAPVPVPSEEAPEAEIPPELDLVCAKALAKEPADRYPSAAAIAEDLARVRTGAPPVARPTSSFALLVRRARREPRRTALLVVASVLTLAAPPLVAWSASAIERAVARAREERDRRAASEAAERAVALAARELAQALPAHADERARRLVEHGRVALEALEHVPDGKAVRAARARALVALGDGLRALGDDAGALERHRAALALEPSPELRARVADAAAALAEDPDPREVARLLERTTREDDPVGLRALAHARLLSGDARGVAAALAMLEKLRPLTADERLWLARSLVARGEHARARALLGSPGTREAWLVRATADLVGGDVEAAVAALGSASAGAGPDDVAARALLLRGALARVAARPPHDGDDPLAVVVHARDRAATPSVRAAASLALGQTALEAAEGPDAVARAEVAFDEARADLACGADAVAGLVRVALARGDKDRALALLGMAEGDESLIAARADVAVARGDPSLLARAREQMRARRVAELASAPPLPASRIAREHAELARALEGAGRRALVLALRSDDPDARATARVQLGLANVLAPRAATLALLARAELAAQETRAAHALAARAALVDPGAPGVAALVARTVLLRDESVGSALDVLAHVLAREELAPGERVELRLLRARALVRLGRLADARDEVRLAARERPEDASILAALATLERKQGDAGTATELERRAAAARDELERLKPRLAEIRKSHASPDEERAVAERVVALAPDEGAAWQVRAYDRLHRDWDVAGSLLDFARCCATDGSAASELLDWSSDFGSEHVLEPERMRAALAEAGAHEEALATAYAQGLAELLIGSTAPESTTAGAPTSSAARYDEALRAFDRALAHDPEARCLLPFRGRALQMLGRTDSARADYQAALALGDSPELAHYYLATLAAREGDARATLAHLEKAERRAWGVRKHARADPDLQPVRQDPEVRAWLERADR